MTTSDARKRHEERRTRETAEAVLPWQVPDERLPEILTSLSQRGIHADEQDHALSVVRDWVELGYAIDDAVQFVAYANGVFGGIVEAKSLVGFVERLLRRERNPLCVARLAARPGPEVAVDEAPAEPLRLYDGITVAEFARNVRRNVAELNRICERVFSTIPPVRPLPTEPGSVIRASIVECPELGLRVLERVEDGFWSGAGDFRCDNLAIAPGWVRLIEETQP